MTWKYDDPTEGSVSLLSAQPSELALRALALPADGRPAPIYPDHWWDSHWWEDLRAAGRYHDEIAKIVLKDPPDAAGTAVELAELLKKQKSTEREKRRLEIIEENEAPPAFYANAFFLDPIRRPASKALMGSVVKWAHPFIFAFKHRYKRARPSQLEPRLRPIIVCPNHPAYPSGHSTQSHLLAYVFGRVSGDPNVEKTLLEAAGRIAKNREYAGVHFASDSAAGAELAKQLAPLFFQSFGHQLSSGAGEWR